MYTEKQYITFKFIEIHLDLVSTFYHHCSGHQRTQTISMNSCLAHLETGNKSVWLGAYGETLKQLT